MTAISAQNYPQPSSSEEWKERGAASIVKTDTDENGNTRTRVLKKGVQDFEFGKNLGIGSYSTVVGATDKQTLRSYAIKILDKRHIIKEKKVKYVDIEKNTLNRLGDHPGIIRLYYTFQDENSLYFVLDFAPNGELLTLIKKMGSLDEQCAQYYGAQILDAVAYMHSKGVVHRDLKPENILLDDRMRVKITDFGTAKLLANEVDANGNKLPTYPQDIRASSFVGTAEYVAPELLADKAQGKPCDIWAFGCILYQLIAGRPPFKGANEYQTFQKIIKLQYSYPPGFPFNVRDLLKHILLLDPNSRWTIPKIKSHVFFDGIDWSRKGIWKQKHPRLAPYKGRSSSTPILKISQAITRTGQQSVSANNSSTNLARKPANPRSVSAEIPITSGSAGSSPGGAANPYSNGNSASARAKKTPASATAAAAALAKPPSSISPHYTPTQFSQQAPSTKPTVTPRPPVVVPRPQIRIRPQPTTSNSTSDLQNASPPTTSRAKPNDSKSNINGGFGEQVVQPMELPAPTSVDIEFEGLIQSKIERVLRVGNVLVATASSGKEVPEASEKEPGKFSKLFSGTRKKKRVILVTTSGRLLVVSSNDASNNRQLHHDIPISSSQVTTREFPFNRKNNVGVFSIETHNKIYTIEDSNGSSDWMSAINKAKEFVANAEAILATRTHNAAAAAAAMAASNASRGAGSGAFHPALASASALAMSGRRPSSDLEHIVNGMTSSMLQRNEERKMLRRGLSFN